MYTISLTVTLQPAVHVHTLFNLVFARVPRGHETNMSRDPVCGRWFRKSLTRVANDEPSQLRWKEKDGVQLRPRRRTL